MIIGPALGNLWYTLSIENALRENLYLFKFPSFRKTQRSSP